MKLNNLTKLPVLLSAGSFLCLIGLMAFTSPTENIVFSVIFFLMLLVLLVSVGYLTIAIKGPASTKQKYHIVIVSLFIVIALMFLSSQSLSWIDAVILLLTVGGVIFYTDRRFSS